MRKYKIYEQKWLVYTFLGLALFPALLINLGLLPLIGDEAIRGLVALEMILSGDYITPTLGGELYFKKPPVYNWIIALYFKGAGSYSDLVLRLPTIVSLILYTLTIFLVTKPRVGTVNALTVALIFLTCGRILFYDSFLGLIDITFSWLIFINFLVIYYFYQKGKIWLLFLVSYTITAMAFLMKGIPALAFQAITLLVIFTWKKKFVELLKWRHITGILILGLIVGTYYFAYFTKNPGQELTVFNTLFNESAQKSSLGFSIWRTVKHLFTFPVEMVYHFFPWFLFVINLFDKRLLEKLKSSEFTWYLSLAFIFNISLYWLSPDTFPRYLLMLVPLAFFVFHELHLMNSKENSWRFKLVYPTFLVMIVLGIITHVVFLFVPETRVVPNAWLKAISVIVLCTIALLMYVKIPNQRLLWVVFVLLMIRVGFNWFILPSRHVSDPESKRRDNAIEVGRATRGVPLHYVVDSISTPTLWYLTRERGEILQKDDSIRNLNVLYLVHDPDGTLPMFEELYKVPIRYSNRVLSIGKLKDEE